MIKDPIRLRLFTMIWIAKNRGKTYPSFDQLEKLVPLDMVCIGCDRKMNWFRKDGHSTVMTLQHDRNGDFRLICQACNVRHAKMPGDSFYDFPKDKKRCPVCCEIKSLDEFWNDNGKRWGKKFNKCKPCASMANKKYLEGLKK